MHMLKPVVMSELSFRDRHSFTSPTDPKQSNQQNKSVAPKTYTPYHQKFAHGIGLSLKTSENRQTQKPTSSLNASQQYFEGYLQRVIKTNLDKMTQIRTEHQKEREIMLKEIMTLKTENSILKSKLQERFFQGNKSQLDKSKQLSQSHQKKPSMKFSSEKLLSPNPQRHEQNDLLIKSMREKIEIFSRETEEYKTLNSNLTLQKKNLNLVIQTLQKQSQAKTSLLERLKTVQEKFKTSQNEAKSLLQATKKQYETEKGQLIKQIQKMRHQKEEKKDKQKEKKNTNVTIVVQDGTTKNTNDPRNIPVDKRMIKHFQSQLKERQVQINERNSLIDELNQKIMSNALIGLNTRYKYLSKA